MAHVSGIYAIDAPASALNNSGKAEEARTENAVAVKKVKAKDGYYPYVSAQAVRYWIRESLSRFPGWKASPIFREGKIAYTDANPILYADDDLFGYMRAPSTKADAKKVREESGLLKDSTELEKGATLTRQSPFKLSTLISIAPLKEVVSDFGVMSRHEGDPVLYEHEFYRTTLQGIFSLDLTMAGRFYHVQRTGFKHLDSVRIQEAEELGLTKFDNDKAYELPLVDRIIRISNLLEAFVTMSGGAKLAVHYTDVAPKFVLLAVGAGGNHLFSTVIGADAKGRTKINFEAIKETVRVYKEELLSGLYVGLVQGYLDEQREDLRTTLNEIAKNHGIKTFLGHPREAVEEFITDMRLQEGKSTSWLD